jgi:hypothetical protein
LQSQGFFFFSVLASELSILYQLGYSCRPWQFSNRGTSKTILLTVREACTDNPASLQLSRIGPLIVSTLKIHFLAKTEAEVRAAQEPGSLDYGEFYPAHLLRFLIVIA